MHEEDTVVEDNGDEEEDDVQAGRFSRGKHTSLDTICWYSRAHPNLLHCAPSFPCGLSQVFSVCVTRFTQHKYV